MYERTINKFEVKCHRLLEMNLNVQIAVASRGLCKL